MKTEAVASYGIGGGTAYYAWNLLETTSTNAHYIALILACAVLFIRLIRDAIGLYRYLKR